MKYFKIGCFLLAILAGIAVMITSCSTALNSAASRPLGVPKSATSKEVSIRVMAYNIHHCNPPSRPDYIDIAAIARTIKLQNPDLVALQEVDVNTERSGKLNQAAELGKQLNMHHYFGKAIDHQGGDYGVAILSRYPLSEIMVNRLPTQAGTHGEPRVLLTARVKLPNGISIRFGTTHLDAQKAPVNRQLQIAEIGKIALAETLPFIIAGDFNATPDTEVMGVLDQHFTRTCQTCSPTIPVINPIKAIDFIAYKHPAGKFEVVSHEVIDEKYASDHLPVLAVIKINP